jgi:hypothetical protein
MLCMVDNKKNKIFKENQFWEDIESIHNHIHGQSKPDLKQLKEDYAFSLEIAAASVGQYIQIAKLDGQLWESYQRLLQGKFTPDPAVVSLKGKFKMPSAPQSCANLCRLGGVPGQLQIAWLDDVICCRMTLKQFSDKCMEYKGEIKLKLHITEHLLALGAIHDTQLQAPTLNVSASGKKKKKGAGPTKKEIKAKEEEDRIRISGLFQSVVSVKFPVLASALFLDPWIRAYAKHRLKDEMPANLKAAVEAAARGNSSKVHFLFALSKHNQN